MSPRAGLSADRVTALALEIVDRDGPDALTLARVAESAGVATPSLYKHIGGLAEHLHQLRHIDEPRKARIQPITRTVG